MKGGEVSVAIINYGVGNLLSIYTSLQKVGARPKIVQDVKEAESFDCVILPGVGAFKPAMRKLESEGEVMLRLLEEKPILGICLGMQLLYERSEEGCPPGEFIEGFGIFKGSVKKLPSVVKIPQMGWNSIKILRKDCPLLKDIKDGIYVYYANSYAAPPSEETAATTSYGITFSALSWKENAFGTQFHPEKSGSWGLKMLRNFIEYAWGWRR